MSPFYPRRRTREETAASPVRDQKYTSTVLDAVIPMVYGPCTVPGLIGFRYDHGAPSYFLDLGIIFALGEQAGVDKVYFNGEEIYPSNTLSTWIKDVAVRLGDGTAVPATLSAHLSAAEQARWEDTYCYVSLTIDCDHADAAATGLGFTAELQGRKVHDFTDGSYPADTPAVSTNPALIAFDILTDPLWKGIDDSRIDYTGTWVGLKEWCEEQVSGVDRFHYIGVQTARNPDAALKEVLDHCFADLYLDADGKVCIWHEGPPRAISGTWTSTPVGGYYVWTGTGGAALSELSPNDYILRAGSNTVGQVDYITDDNTFRTIGGAYTPTPMKVRLISGTYINGHDWVEPPEFRDVPKNEISDVVIVRYTLPDYDGNVQYPAPGDVSDDRRSEVTLRGCRSGSMAKRWSETREALNKAQVYEWTGDVNGEGAAVAPGDVIQFDDAPGSTRILSGRLARVLPPVEWNQKEGTYTLHLLAFDNTVFSDSTKAETVPGGGKTQTTSSDLLTRFGDLYDVDTSGATVDTYTVVYDLATDTFRVEPVTNANVPYNSYFQGYDSLSNLRNLIGVAQYAGVDNRIVIGADNNLEIVLTSPLGADLMFNDNDEGIVFGYGGDPALYRASDGYLCLDFSFEVEGIRIDPGGSGGRVIIGGIGDYSHLAMRNTGEVQGYTVGGTRIAIGNVDSSDRIVIGDAGYTLRLYGQNTSHLIQLDGGGTKIRGADVLMDGELFLETNNKNIKGRNYANTAWLRVMRIDTTNQIRINEDAAGALILYGTAVRTLGCDHRLDQGWALQSRNVANSAYYDLVYINGSDQIVYGDYAADSLLLLSNVSGKYAQIGTTAGSTGFALKDLHLSMRNGYRMYWLNYAGTTWRSGIHMNASDQFIINESADVQTYIYGSSSNYLALATNATFGACSVIIDNNKWYYSKEVGGTSRIFAGMTTGDQFRLGQNTNRLTMYSNGNVYLYGAGFRLDNAYYLYGLNQAGTNAYPVAGVDSGDTCHIGHGSWTKLLLKGPYIRYETSAWDDLRVSANSVRVPTSAAPTWSTFKTSLQLPYFSATATNSVYFTVQLPHRYKEGTDIYPHVHWTPSTTNTGNVRWGLAYTWVNIDGTFAAESTIYVLDAGAGAADTHQVAPFAAITGTSKDISSMLVCRLFRDGADAADTFTGTAGLLEFDFHYEVDAPGSDAETSKT